MRGSLRRSLWGPRGGEGRGGVELAEKCMAVSIRLQSFLDMMYISFRFCCICYLLLWLPMSKLRFSSCLQPIR